MCWTAKKHPTDFSHVLIESFWWCCQDRLKRRPIEKQVAAKPDIAVGAYSGFFRAVRGLVACSRHNRRARCANA
tara:strand:- start:1005 stop:1226 length:222 start_codon:yes stop_codon:yes gene_type:complete